MYLSKPMSGGPYKTSRDPKTKHLKHLKLHVLTHIPIITLSFQNIYQINPAFRWICIILPVPQYSSNPAQVHFQGSKVAPLIPRDNVLQVPDIPSPYHPHHGIRAPFPKKLPDPKIFGDQATRQITKSHTLEANGTNFL